MMMQQQQ
jgi:polyadenylate-binding protein